MIHSLLLFFGHGGFKLLLIGFFFVMRMVKSSAKKAQNREDVLRGKTSISDFSTPAAKADLKPQPLAPRPVAAPQPKTPLKKPSSTSNSPWSSNQNPFQ